MTQHPAAPTRKKTPNAAEYLNGQSPRARGEAKLKSALEWIYLNGWTSADLLRQVVGQAAGGYAAKLVRSGLLVETRTQSGCVQKGVPKSVLTLSRIGLEEAERFRTDSYPYIEINPLRIPQHLIRHNLIAQQLTLTALRSGSACAYFTERMLQRAGDKKEEKKPDVEWKLCMSGDLAAVEVELSAKWGRDLDDFILKICIALDDRKGPPRYNKFFIFSDSPAILARYEKALAPGSRYMLWRSDPIARKYYKETALTVPDYVHNRIQCSLLRDA